MGVSNLGWQCSEIYNSGRIRKGLVVLATAGYQKGRLRNMKLPHAYNNVTVFSKTTSHPHYIATCMMSSDQCKYVHSVTLYNHAFCNVQTGAAVLEIVSLFPIHEKAEL